MIDFTPSFIREEVLKTVRSFFYNQHFHEVITPSLNRALPLEPHIYAFSTQWKTAFDTTDLYLSTSPESGLKKMLAEGIGNCFAISKSFRNLEGAGSLHTPEFLMLEWYRENADYTAIMRDVQELVLHIKYAIDAYLGREKSPHLTYQNTTISLEPDWPVFSLIDLFKTHAHLDYFAILEDTTIRQAAKKKNYTIEDATWAELFDQIFVNEVEPKLPKTPFFITDFPARISPLCTVKKDNPQLVERFEVFMFGMELGNGNTENTDSTYVYNLFQQELQNRKRHAITAPPIDATFIAALEKMSSKTYGGIGLGVDRLAMIMADKTSITDVELFYR